MSCSRQPENLTASQPNDPDDQTMMGPSVGYVVEQI